MKKQITIYVEVKEDENIIISKIIDNMSNFEAISYLEIIKVDLIREALNIKEEK